MLTNLFRRDPKLMSVDAPISVPLDQSPVPDMVELETEVGDRVGRLIAAGATDEYCAHVIDGYLDAWHAEVAVSLAGLADEQHRVDRALVDLTHHRADLAAARAEVAEERARRVGAAADRLWADYEPPAPVEPVAPVRLVR
ncbi:hypothetical protein ACGFIX_14410 [Nocardia salmonicida]|uniref:hypothetical protein n=1 Tax=Nocardia salmonicida TaxID=53431 RepID=UPI003722A1F5